MEENIIPNCSTLDELKAASENCGDTSLLSKRKCLYNQSDASIKIEKMLNTLISEYNSIAVYNKEKLKDYNESLFTAFEVFMPFLSQYGQFYALLNRCILSDDDSNQRFHDTHFKESIKA